MLILALDTSGDVCSLALLEDEKCLSAFSFRHERTLTERLPGALGFVLSDRKVALTAIEGIAVGLGPGSFTGVRVAVTMAKVWAMSLSVPLVGVSSLDAQAAPFVPLETFAIASVVPARRSESIVAFYAPGTTTPLAAPQVMLNADICAQLTDQFPNMLGLICGENAFAIRDTTPLPGVRFIVQSLNAADIGRLAHSRFASSTFDDVDTLVPLYVAPTPVG